MTERRANTDAARPRGRVRVCRANSAAAARPDSSGKADATQDASASAEEQSEPLPMRGPLAASGRRRWPDPRRANTQSGRCHQPPTNGRFWRPPRGRRGFSLLELLVAATLGAVLTVAVARLFTDAGRANAEQVGQARLQESLRHALGFLGRSIRGAGFLGCGADTPRNGLRGDLQQLVEFNIATPVQGFDGVVGSAAWRPDLAALPLRRGAGAPTFRRGGIDPSRLRRGSDILVLRRLATPLHPLRARVAAHGDPLVVLDRHRAIRKSRFAALTRCGGAALFRVTSVARRGGAATLVRAVGSGPFGNRGGAHLLGDAPGGASFGDAHGPGGAAVGLVLSEIYFVARAAGATARGDAAWSLWRKTSAERPVELVRGVDELQLLFGVDESPDNGTVAAERLTPPGMPAGAVRSVHVAVTAGAPDAGGGAGARSTFAATFAVRNR